jgi:hypothetical protein
MVKDPWGEVFLHCAKTDSFIIRTEIYRLQFFTRRAPHAKLHAGISELRTRDADHVLQHPMGGLSFYVRNICMSLKIF